MGLFKLKGLQHGAQLKYLGNFFRRRNSSSAWKVSTKFEGDERTRFSDYSLLPILAINRTYVETPVPNFEPNGFKLALYLPTTGEWLEETLSSWQYIPTSIRKSEFGKQKCFRFTSFGRQVWLPKIELARALFFSSAYMTRQAFLPNGLETSFRIQKSVLNNLVVEALPGANVPKILFQDPVKKSTFATILLTDGGLQSFESISQSLMENAVESDQYVRWNFDFTPPELSGSHIEVRCHFDPESNACLVYEITGMSNIPIIYEHEIHFVHPDIKEYHKQGGGRSLVNLSPIPDETELDEEEVPSSNNTHIGVTAPLTRIRFSKQIKYKTKPRIQTSKAAVKSDENENSRSSVRVSVQEGGQDGTIPQAEFDGINDSDNKTTYYEKFSVFGKVIKNLVECEGFYLKKYTASPLPPIKGCLLHLNDDGSPRLYALATIVLPDSSERHILEISLTDGKRALSSQVLKFPNNSNHEYLIKKILKKTVKRSLRWPQKYFDDKCIDHQRVNHPRKLATTENIEKFVERWVALFRSRLIY